jgi:hypothetical protein
MTSAKTLRNQETQSCGCLGKERRKIGCTKHDSCKTPEYTLYINMIQRCTNPRNPHFKNYGGRGITICQPWLESFVIFLKDIGAKPSPKHTLERKDNELGYSPENCCWATRKAQINNRRNTRFVMYEGIRMPLSEAADRAGITIHQAGYLLKKGKWHRV